ncbi:hypothetical protein DEV92_101463 [Phyllobacterium myrsinacearum]|nr:hypothetical protein DEV92_101463 [Phyllobacterium myrsinacearum]RZV09527.1 hypothetical protein EV654_0626 [Phyllobacterium myrsinacearum]
MKPQTHECTGHRYAARLSRLMGGKKWLYNAGDRAAQALVAWQVSIARA